VIVRRYRGIGALGVAMVITVTSACSVVEVGLPVAVGVEKRGPAGVVPLELAGFYSQSLAWVGCGQFANDTISESLFGAKGLECARLRVPMDYARPEDRSIFVGLLRKKATDARIGSLVVNPGGPGQSGMVAAAGMAQEGWTGELAKRFDLVGFDPRGIGASTPKVRCMTDAEKDADRLEPPIEGVSPEAVARIEQENQKLAGLCAQRSGAELLANLGTRDVVQDMDILRSVLGDQKLTYLGFSYGTRIGTAYAERFPGNVRAMILDGAVDPNADRVAQVSGQVNGFKKAFEAFAAWCAGQPQCALGKSATAAEAQLNKLIDPLKRQPVTVGTRKLSYSDASIAVAQGLYSEELWQPMHTGLQELAVGKGEMLLRLSDFYQGRGQDGVYSGSQDAFTAVRCVDDPPVKDRAVLADEHRRISEAIGPDAFGDDEEIAPALSPCAFWPVQPTGQPHEPKVAGLPKLLVISTTGDPATPYHAGVNLAKALGASLLTVEGNNHTAFLQGKKCVDDAGTAYLLELTQPAENARCA
jgi:pimeloyl-ACP methyl ester carboxylesterase